MNATRQVIRQDKGSEPAGFDSLILFISGANPTEREAFRCSELLSM